MGDIQLGLLFSLLDNTLLSCLTLGSLVTFVTLASKLKDDILLTQPACHLATQPPDVLPPSIVHFLGDCCNLTPLCVVCCWDALKSVIWHGPELICNRSEALFTEYGRRRGLSSRTLYPPGHSCLKSGCSRTGKGLLLKKMEAQQAVLYTLDQGPMPVYSIQLYCEACRITYHHNFQVEDEQRTYFDAIPDVIQVGKHQFAEHHLVELWIHLMLVSWTSATNCARIYNLLLSHNKTPPEDWAFGFTISSDHVWDGFLTLALLEDCQRRQQTLVVPHGGMQKDRFAAAINARNVRFQLYGQPELRHHCHKCLRVYTDEIGQVARKVWVVVIDSVTIGHPCCAVHNCFTPLASNRNRFCPMHALQYSKICAIVGCTNSVVAGSLVCDVQSHRDFEHIHHERGQARFQLKERLECARVTHPNDALAEEHEIIDGVDEYTINHDNEDPLKHTTKATKIRAKFTRDRTHNEQVITAPCGIILARETFYGAEGVASVVEIIKRTFRDEIKPDHIFYDNNCMLAKVAKGDPFFGDIALTVDVFHFKSKHSVTDTFCQTHCNPAAFPELISDDGKGWYFNSSIAEQTNVWIGGYHSICREMLVGLGWKSKGTLQKRGHWCRIVSL